MKMKSEDVSSETILAKFTQKYLTFHNLKDKYKLFIDNLTEIDLANEGEEIFLLFYSCAKLFYQSLAFRVPSYLQNYSAPKFIENESTKFVHEISSKNLSRLFERKDRKIKFEVSMFMKYFWSREGKA